MSGPNIDTTRAASWSQQPPFTTSAPLSDATQDTQVRNRRGQPIIVHGQLTTDAPLLSESAPTQIPQLPDPQGDRADAERLEQVLRASHGFVQGSDAVFETVGGAVAALDALAQRRQDNIMMARTLKNLHNQQQVSAKIQELFGKQDEVHGQRVSANLMFFASTAASIATLGLASLGGSLKQSNPNSVLGPSLRKIAQPAGHAMNQAANFLDINALGRREAQLAQVEQKSASITTQVAQNAENNADAWLNQVQEQRKQALQALMAQVQMWGQSISELWR